MRFAPAATLLVMLLAASASASPVAVSEAESPSTVTFDIGLASAVGELGFAYTRTLSDHFALEGGIGYGWTGLQLSVMPKLVFGSAHHQFVAGAGLSFSVPGPKLSRGGHQPMAWLNVDLVGYQYRSDGGFVFTIAGGLTTSLATGITAAIDENNAGSVNLSGYTIPQFRIGLGFGL